MGAELPRLSEEEINNLAKDLMYLIVFHGVIDENELDEQEKIEYEEWREKYEKELNESEGDV